MKVDKNITKLIADAVRLGMDRILLSIAQVFSYFRGKSFASGYQFKELFATTSDQVREKAEETRKAVKLRMAVLEIEHHLNRLYPQIGKITCDLVDEGKRSIFSNENLKGRIQLAQEYRARLSELRAEQESNAQEQENEA